MTANLLVDALRNLWDSFVTRLPSLATGLLAILVFSLAARIVRFALNRSISKVRPSGHAAQVISRLGFVAVLILGILVGLGVMGINAAVLVASLGLVSVGVGFALKDVIENFIAGVILILQRPFVVGDVVQIGDVEGSVEDIRVRDTVIRMFDGRQVFVPNAGIFTKAVINNNRNRRRRLEFDVGISYTADTRKAIQEASQALSGVAGILRTPPPLVIATTLGDSSISLKAHFWVDPVEVNLPELKSDAIVALRQRLEAAGIAMPPDTDS